MLKILSLASTSVMLLTIGACAQGPAEQNKAAGTIVTNDVAAFQAGAGPDRRLTLEEYRAVSRQMVTALDTDANGALSTAELAAIPQEGRRAGWATYDINGDGTLDAAEIQGMSAKFSIRDLNLDGAITPDEIPASAPAGSVAEAFLF